MGNHYYIVSVSSLYSKPSESQVFADDLGINLQAHYPFSIPKISDLLHALKKFGIEIKEDILRGKRREISGTHSSQSLIGIIFVNEINNEDTIDMFKLDRWSDPHLVIAFVKSLEPSFGQFIYYCDTGEMTLITAEKSNEMIYNELFG